MSTRTMGSAAPSGCPRSAAPDTGYVEDPLRTDMTLCASIQALVLSSVREKPAGGNWGTTFKMKRAASPGFHMATLRLAGASH